MDVTWRVGLALESSLCVDLKEPFVTLVFEVTSEAGTKKCQTIELSVAQFQEIASQFKEMERLLDVA